MRAGRSRYRAAGMSVSGEMTLFALIEVAPRVIALCICRGLFCFNYYIGRVYHEESTLQNFA